MNLFRISRLFFGLLLAFCLAIPVRATLELTQTTVDKAFAPQGTKVAMIYFKLKATGGDTNFTSVQFQNNSPSVFFGEKVSKVFLFRDNDNNGVQGSFDEGSETQLDSLTFTSRNTAPQSLRAGLTISSGNSVGFFIVYQLESNADLSATTSIQLLDIDDSDFNFGSSTVTNVVTITGLDVVSVSDIAPPVVLPGQQFQPMLKLSLRMNGEELNRNVQFTIENNAANFVTDSSKKDGVTTAYLYRDRFGIGSFDSLNPSNYDLLKQVNAGSFTSSSSVTFSFPNRNDINIGVTTTVDMYVVYDIGEDFQVTNDTKVKAQLVNFEGLGSESGATVSITDDLPAPAADAAVAGLSYNTTYVKSLIRSGDTFGRNSIVPMFQYEIRANQTDFNIVTVNIQNPGSVPFITSRTDPKNVQKIALYLDSDRDGVFNGADGTDTKVAELTLGTGSNQQDRAVVTMNLTTSGSVTIRKFDSVRDSADGYNLNNAARFFVVYTFGSIIFPSVTSTANAGPHSIARLENIVGTTNVSGNIYSVNLSGARPLASSPDALVVLNGALDVIISSANSISPTFSIQGQVKVPLLYVTLDSASNFTSTNVKILNEFASFSPTSLGVSKIWLYRDSNSNQILDTSDTLLGTQSNPTDIATASITSVPIFSGRNDLIILYDIGANSPTGSSGVANARAQLSSVSSEGNLKFGGQSLPFPTTAASTLILDRRLTLSKIILGNPSGETYPTTFEVGMKLSNTTTGNVILTDAQPRFYIGSISGADISYEFTSTPEFSLPFTVTQNSETIVTFNVTRSTPVTDGTAVIDGFVDYVVPDSIYPIAVTPGIAELIRYRGANGWVPASSETSAVQIQASSSQYYWTVPAYIKSMEILVNGSTLPFANFDSIPKQTQLTLKFVNSGQNVDENSIKVFLNGILLTRKAVVSSGLSAIRPAATTGNYSFDASTGTLIVDDMGSTTGSLVVTLSDLEGNTLPTLALNFTISDRVKIENMYFFPNPYLRSASQPLVLGFGLTQPANLTVYLFNQVGNLVWTEKRRFSSVGYHTWETSFNQDFVTSGIYLCKMYAEDDNGNKSSAVTKLAIY